MNLWYGPLGHFRPGLVRRAASDPGTRFSAGPPPGFGPDCGGRAASARLSGTLMETILIGTLELRFLRTRHETGGSLDMFEMTCPPNGRVPVPHYHRDWDETVYGLSGITTFTLDGTETEVGPGDTLFIQRGIVHGFVNRSEGSATCLCVLTPGVLGPEYFREMAAELTNTPPDPAVLRSIMERYGLVPG